MTIVNAQAVIEDALKAIPTDGQPWSAAQMAHLIMTRLDSAGVAVLNPQDLEWGECPGNPVDGVSNDSGMGPHYVSTSLCSGCLEYDPS